ncbi:Hsp70 family protein [Microbacterium sp. QXD-8]|uniref:Hsp70 family protein n=1 Tax=Microbacterium psychrotolerans TaxID=3068321 RepID=A0ABU0Z4G6_9MICO|nr:Hsp70 family protein [Microbacterium sp. QXD-8]MDQ7878416.1 Hsp70 family protein [Microbacterium sp. QXD-8]
MVFVAEDGDLLFGDAAERRGVGAPERLIREFKRSIGDDVPLVVGDQSIPAEQLYARTVAGVIDAVTEREGGEPAGVIITHPAMWGPHRVGTISSALAALGIRDVEFITEPEAAARHYEASRVLEPGETLAVYDLGGGTFDCVLLRKTETSFELLGEPMGLDNLGGADFDDAVVRHVLRSAEVSPEALDDSSADARVALSQLRRECVDAKEALSFDSDVVVPVLLPAGRSSVRLTRAEFEDMIDPYVTQTVDVLEDALEAADVEPEQLESVLLIGGSSRIPLVTQRISERLDRPTAIDADPKASIALGAAYTALIRAMDREIAAPGELVVYEGVSAGGLELAVPAAAGLAAPVAPVAASSAHGARHYIAISAAAALVAAAIVFGSTMTLGNGSGTFLSLSGWDPAAPAPAEVEAEAAAQVEPAADANPPETATAPEADTGSGGTVNPKAGKPKSRSDAPTSKAGPDRTTTTTTTATTKEGTSTQPAAGSSGTTPTSSGDDTPGQTTQPQPDPTTQPEPEPTTQPEPEPEPEPTTQPEPEPEQEPEPQPEPEPETTTPPADPAPEPVPADLQPAPETSPAPEIVP